MKLVLRKDIDKLGFCGDVVDVSTGYARNYLLPHHLALEPSRANLKSIEEDKKRAAAERERKRTVLLQTAEHLKGVEVTIAVACTPEGHLYGSVGPREISRALIDDGHAVHADQIKMSEHVKKIGIVEVPVVLAADLSVPVKVWVVAEKSLKDKLESTGGTTDESTGDTDVAARNDAADRPAAGTSA